MYGMPTLAPRFAEPLEMLEACHRRIETQLASLELLARHLAKNGSDAESREAARFAIRFFDVSALQHHRDEDEDLFPLLRALAAERSRAEIAGVIHEIEAEHATMDLQWSRLRERLDAIVHGREARLDVEEVGRFAWLYRRHMRTEAAALLPFAKEALSASQRAWLGERMAARRNSAM